MIIYGTKAKEILSEHVTDKCANCNTQNNIDIHVFQKYAHVFWIPFFPMSKTGLSRCEHCKQMLNPKEMPPNLLNAYETLKSSVKPPVWMWSGLSLVVVLVVSGIISDKMNDRKNAEYILSPKEGDYYSVKTKDHQYTIYKVNVVDGDSVYVQFNNFESDKYSGMHQLKNKGFSEDLYGFSKSELKEMFDNGEIMDIER